MLNLNVPSLPLAELRGVRQGRISTAGLIKSATDPARRGPGDPAPTSGGPLDGRTPEGEEEGRIVLTLGAAVPALGDVGEEDDQDDGALVHAGYASLTPILGVHEAVGPAVDELMRSAWPTCARAPPAVAGPRDRDQPRRRRRRLSVAG